MASPNRPASGSLKRQRDMLKCDCCRKKKRRVSNGDRGAPTCPASFSLSRHMLNVQLQCYPHHRNWLAGEKCEPCELGGQGCGPNVRHHRKGGAGASLSHVSEPALLLPRIPKSDPHPTSPNAGEDRDLLFTNRVPAGEGSSATRSGPDSQSQEANATSVTETITFPSSQQSAICQRLEDYDDAPNW
jgi:hypothetical protein